MKIIKAARIVTLITGLVIAGMFFSSPVSAQDISGTWHGKLSIPTGSLTIVFHISQTGQGTYVTTLDSPDQGANGIKTQTTSFNDSILTIQIPIIHASYKGKLDSNQTISGTFTQGMSIPLNLEKGEASRPKRPQEPQPPFPYKSEEVIERNEQDGINLAGTLTLPQKGTKFPAVVMVTGSGAQNRNEEIMGHKPFLVIADYLTRNGIAVGVMIGELPLHKVITQQLTMRILPQIRRLLSIICAAEKKLMRRKSVSSDIVQVESLHSSLQKKIRRSHLSFHWQEPV